jgi:hypothetical protein
MTHINAYVMGFTDVTPLTMLHSATQQIVMVTVIINT